jgi:lysophospholipase L1-like esterase
MRRFLFWYLPLTAGLAAACVFAYGFASYIGGNRGERVGAAAPARVVASKQAMLTPVILGDSLARGAGDERGLGIAGRLDAELRRRGLRAARTTNLGVNGARTQDLLRQLESTNVQGILRSSNTIIVSIGGNDLWGGTDWRNVSTADAEQRMNAVVGRVDQILQRIRTANPKARVFFIGLYNPFVRDSGGTLLTPLVHRWNGRLLDEFGDDPNFTLVSTVDLFSHQDRLSADRFHPGGEGYELIARRIAEGV